MQFRAILAISAISLTCSTLISDSSASAQRPSVDAALKFAPLQKSDVEYDDPVDAAKSKCTLESASKTGQSGWIVLDGNGRLLRRFVDTNKDKQIDNWCYYREGIEVYRDIDTDNDNNADTFVWLGTAGIRRGKDTDGDFKIDRWERISAEEVTSEIVQALRDRDPRRFKLLVPTDEEIDALGFNTTETADLKKKAANALSQFETLVKSKAVLGSKARWVHFGGTRPSLIPEGTGGSTKDLIVYENVVALLEDGNQNSQLAVGTLVNIGNGWRTIDVPELLVAGKAPAVGGYFIETMIAQVDVATGAGTEGVSSEMQELIGNFQDIETQLEKAKTAEDIAKLNGLRADILEKMVYAADAGEEKINWARQFTETLAGASRRGEFPEGLDRIEAFLRKIEKDKDFDQQLTGHIKYRLMSTRYSQQLSDPEADLEKVQDQWQKNLEQFVADYPLSENAPDAMLDLGFAEEFAAAVEADSKKRAEMDGNAEKWYQRIVQEFPKSSIAAKAAGAVRRINSVGKRLDMQGIKTDGKPLAISDAQGKIVVLHYWATYCDSCLKEMETINELNEKYGSRGFQAIGVNVDSDSNLLKTHLQNSKLPNWPQLYEKGGLDGRLATELGVLTLPTMLLIDRDGKVVNRNVTSADLEDEVKKLLQKKD